MKLLLVEDDERVGQYLESSLSSTGYSVTWCKTIEQLEAVMAMNDQEFTVAVMDRMIGREDAALSIQKLKSRFNRLPVLILSSIDSPIEKARWLDQGAEDYMGKPFVLEELVARLRNLVKLHKSTATTENHTLVFADVVIDLMSHQISIQGQRADFTKKEFQLLLMLVEKPGRVFDKFQILDRVWGTDSSAESNVVEVSIRNLRKKLEEAGSKAQILSRRHVGYWIEA